MKVIFTNYDQSRKLRRLPFTKGLNSFIGIVDNSTRLMKIEIINDRNREMIETLCDFNRTQMMPVYCLSDLIEICKNNCVDISDIEDIHDSAGFGMIVERIVNSDK